jgi:DNA modification methylase
MQWDTIFQGSCTELLPQVIDESVDLVFADPPFNIGLKYDLYEDKKDYNAYCDWVGQWLGECYRVLKPEGSIFIAIGDEYAAEINIALKRQGFFFRNWVIWYYTFGENQKKKFNRCHTHILYFTKSSTKWTWNADAIKVPSARQVKYGDKRAKAGGKLPDDVWEIGKAGDGEKKAFNWVVEDDCWGTEDDVRLPEDVWKVSRVCGTFKERIKREDGTAHPCQMPEAILKRIILGSSNEGDVVVDPFCGTGTTAAVAYREGRKFWTCDISAEYCSVAAARIFGTQNRFVSDLGHSGAF